MKFSKNLTKHTCNMLLGGSLIIAGGTLSACANSTKAPTENKTNPPAIKIENGNVPNAPVAQAANNPTVHQNTAIAQPAPVQQPMPVTATRLPVPVAAAKCAPEALAVGIKHFAYNEASSSDLVWSGYGSQSDSKYKIHQEAKAALQELVNAARRDGVSLTPGSIFRSVARQKQIVANKKSQGQSARQIYYTSSHPGFSEHHTGLTVDFSPIENSFANTAGYRWLVKNANQYGWYQSFTKDYTAYSGIAVEPWHWRYEGKQGEYSPIFAASKNRSC
ncbi:LD-carboxypeptidase LdcB, LAS superfamily [Moraxella cuniculi DSM 21768]|uniref:LD-carboxypeptidase LdcB, LAS superfamily n=1 Tax=Moraxella cuniculi DSM 21768 TaxID=1122245 RepID=A0A1N7EDP9_9GAMM|nr:M15 family metallopeptidase [Moraxella cuniculi]OOS05331.1 hypothetical protein B0189_06900 [Moraxella cuniculi]SIR86098.1 LD-carboxypeptidase LdcB, LAS superfamily [Moraxella cuniculi DSM 21768]